MSTHFLYAASLLFVLSCLALVDWRYKLAFHQNRLKAVRVMAAAMVFFVIWDVVGIKQRIFYTGDSHYIVHRFIIANFPIEELLFLAVLSYTTLLIWRFTERLK